MQDNYLWIITHSIMVYNIMLNVPCESSLVINWSHRTVVHCHVSFMRRQPLKKCYTRASFGFNIWCKLHAPKRSVVARLWEWLPCTDYDHSRAAKLRMEHLYVFVVECICEMKCQTAFSSSQSTSASFLVLITFIFYNWNYELVMLTELSTL